MHRPEQFVKGKLAERGVTQKQVAATSGKDFRTVSHVIRGRRSDHALPVLIAISTLTGVPLGSLQEMYAQQGKAA